MKRFRLWLDAQGIEVLEEHHGRSRFAEFTLLLPDGGEFDFQVLEELLERQPRQTIDQLSNMLERRGY
jgi:hypothetical protein